MSEHQTSFQGVCRYVNSKLKSKWNRNKNNYWGTIFQEGMWPLHVYMYISSNWVQAKQQQAWKWHPEFQIGNVFAYLWIFLCWHKFGLLYAYIFIFFHNVTHQNLCKNMISWTFIKTLSWALETKTLSSTLLHVLLLVNLISHDSRLRYSKEQAGLQAL